MCTEETLQWSPLNYLQFSNGKSTMAVIVLNRPILASFKVVSDLWQRAAVRATVDGGTDRWLTFLKQNNINIDNIKPPDVVTGDMDSVLPETLNIFKERGSKIIHTPDQNETDFTKALRQVKLYAEEKSLRIETIMVLVESSGRMDHIMANINTLYKAQNIMPKSPVMLMSSGSLTWLLTKGRHYIEVPISLWKQKSWCAIIPIGARCENITTDGLKWNLKRSVLEFGGMVSTSNTYGDKEAIVKIETSCPVLWSMGTQPVMNAD